MTPVPNQPTRHDAIALTGALWIACFVLCYALLATPVSGDNSGLMKLTESYGALGRVALWQQTLSWLPGGHADGSFVSWPKPAIVWMVRAAMLAMFAIHALAFRQVWRSPSARPWPWLIGPIGAQAIMLLMVPSNADVFFYAISGDIANRGLNPYSTPIYEVFQNPLYAYNHWVDMTTVYGPLWTLITQGIIAITGPDPANAVLGFKLLLGTAAVLLAAGTYRAARLLGASPTRSTAAMVLVGWQPNIVMEAAGQAHNDVVMIALVLAGVIVSISGATRGGVVLATMSVVVKYVSLPVLGLLALTRLDRFRHRGHASGPVNAWALDGLAMAAVLVAAFAPYWTGPTMVSEMVSEPGRLYSNPLWHIPASAIRELDSSAGAMFESVTRALAQLVTIAIILVALARFAMAVWRSSMDGRWLPSWAVPMVAAWAAIFSALAYLPVNVHAWYWTWPVVPIALLVALDTEGTRWQRRRWLAPWLVGTAVLTLIYHTRIVHP